MSAKIGELIVITTGEYSDYSSRGLFKVTREFDPEQVLKDYLTLHSDEAREYGLDNSSLLNYFVQNNFLTEIEPPPWRELHLPEYGCASSGIKLFDRWDFLS